MISIFYGKIVGFASKYQKNMAKEKVKIVNPFVTTGYASTQ